MSKTLLITRPNHDYDTDYLYHWSEFVINEAKKHKFKVLDLKSGKANQKNFVSYVKNQFPNIVFLNGHGSDNCITGHDNEIILAVGENDTLLKGMIVYARSCNCGKILGDELTRNGTKAFIGYTYSFGFMRLNSYSTRPRLDPLARLCLEPSNIVPITLVKGHSILEAYNRSQEGMKKNLRRILSSSSSQEERSVLPFLLANFKGQVLIGDITAKV